MTTYPAETLPYPRRIALRALMRGGGRLLLALLTRLKVSGMQNFPRRGPVILAGNHVGVMEAVLMAALSPRQVEFLGTGDIPIDPNYARVVKAYGLIPINRGNLDRDGIQKSVDVLRQGGVLGVFPEGGIWDPARMEAQLGVALISQRANAPVLPIGFGGMRGALANALHLKRPQLEMHVGQLIPSAALPEGADRRQALQAYASMVLQRITALIPPSELTALPEAVEYALRLEPVSPPPSALPQLAPERSRAFARLLFSPVLLDALHRNLQLPVGVWIDPPISVSNAEFSTALAAVLEYLECNPGFFTYRFGVPEGLALGSALADLRAILGSARESGLSLRLEASSHTRYTGGRAEEKSVSFVIVP
ncbi:MAG: lysophospholipid acyltransferase family protein [Anaerolineaceae bacterium]